MGQKPAGKDTAMAGTVENKHRSVKVEESMDENNNYNNNYNGGYNNSGSQQNYGQDYGRPYMTPEEAPMTMTDWLITLIVAAIPCVNIIMLFVWGFGNGGNVNRRNYCRAQLIIMAVGMVLAAISWGGIMAMLANVAGAGMY